MIYIYDLLKGNLDLAEIINDLVFGKVTFDSEMDSWFSTKYIETISQEISIRLDLKDKKIPDKFKKIFINFWDNYELIESKLAESMLKFYQEDGIEWSANELSILAIVDNLNKGLTPDQLVDEADIEPPEINTLSEIRKTMTLEEIKISYFPKEYLSSIDDEEYSLKLNYEVTWLSEEITIDINPETFEIDEVALARYIYY